MQAAKQIRLSRNCGGALAFPARRPWIESIHLKQNSALRRIDGMFSTAANAAARSPDRGCRCRAGQVELHVQRFLVQLPRQVHARFRRVDVR
jgi:hypothetical protein